MEKTKFKSLQGQFLLDGGNLRGSFFQRTVVLICQHDPEGAFGLVLNRATDSTVGAALTADLPPAVRDQTLFLGGPVQPEALSYLHADAGVLQSNVIENLHLGHALDDLVELCESHGPATQLKIFAGYSGWGPGQLDDEMRRKAWVTHPASLEMVFQSDASELWQKILRSKGWRYRLLSMQPEDLSSN
jgi:putative transcriptional regulator